MGKPTVVVSKHGAVLWTQATAYKASNVGEIGDTEGIIRYLATRDDIQVVYLGSVNGELPANVVHAAPDPDKFSALNDMSPGSLQVEVAESMMKVAREFDVRVYLNITGYTATMSWLDNPKHTFLQSCAVRYIGPQLYCINELKAPRVLVNHDPRNYPKDQEMSILWPTLVPCALLSQRSQDYTTVVGGKKYLRREVYSGAENWAYRPSRVEQLLLPRDVPCTVVSHAHIGDGCKSKGREESWSRILGPRDELVRLYEMGTRVYGKGWEHFSLYAECPDMFPGTLNPHAADEVLARSVCGPMVTSSEGFYTTKVNTYLNQGCVPLFYGRGEPFTYDPLFRYLRPEDSLRVAAPGELRVMIEHFLEHTKQREAVIADMMRFVRPDFSMLDQCIDECIAGADVRSDEFFARYGGYRAV